MRDHLAAWKERHRGGQHREYFKDLSARQWLIIFQIGILLANLFVIPLIIVILYFVCPPVSYKSFYQDKPLIVQNK